MATQFSPGAIFSPSQARQQLVQAKDWNYVDTWLSSHYGGRPAPPFERNSETLKVLLALAAYNEAADEERDLLQKLEMKALQHLRTEAATDSDAELLEALIDSLVPSGRASLEMLARLAVTASTSTISFSAANLAQHLLDLAVTEQTLIQRAEHIATLHEQLERTQTRLTNLLVELKSPAFDTPATLIRETSELQRATKHLSAKRVEYDTRLEALQTTVELPDVGIAEVVKEEKTLGMLKERVAEKETKVKAYHGLPHDMDLAKLEVERVRREVRRLVKERDRLFEGLVENKA